MVPSGQPSVFFPLVNAGRTPRMGATKAVTVLPCHQLHSHHPPVSVFSPLVCAGRTPRTGATRAVSVLRQSELHGSGGGPLVSSIDQPRGSGPTAAGA